MDLLISNINILLYITALVVTIVLYQKKKRFFDAGSILLFSYLLYSIMSLILFNIDNPFYTFEEIRLFPFIYLYLMLMITAAPILKYDQSKIQEIEKPGAVFFNTAIIIFIVSSLIQLPEIISDFNVNIVKLFASNAGGQDIYDESMSNSITNGDGDIANIAAIISNSFGNFGILMFFYYLTFEKKNKLILIGLSLSVVIGLFVNISMGQRGPVLEILLSFIITYFALRKFMSEKTIKTIKYIGIFLIVAVSVPFIALTNSRFEDADGGSLTSVYYYAGQENLFFNNYGLDDGGIRYGDRTFPFFKSLMGYENIPQNFWERREKYPELKINDEVFIGFIGDFTLDFGPVLPPIIFIIFTLFVLNKTKVKDETIYFHQIILIHFVMIVCMLGGLKLYPFSDVGGNLQLIVYFLAYQAFKIDHFIKRQHRSLN